MKTVELFPSMISVSINPFSLRFFFSNIFPDLSSITEIPELADLTNGTPFSTDLKIEDDKCCLGPVVLPNQASLVILT